MSAEKSSNPPKKKKQRVKSKGDQTESKMATNAGDPDTPISNGNYISNMSGTTMYRIGPILFVIPLVLGGGIPHISNGGSFMPVSPSYLAMMSNSMSSGTGMPQRPSGSTDHNIISNSMIMPQTSDGAADQRLISGSMGRPQSSDSATNQRFISGSMSRSQSLGGVQISDSIVDPTTSSSLFGSNSDLPPMLMDPIRPRLAPSSRMTPIPRPDRGPMVDSFPGQGIMRPGRPIFPPRIPFSCSLRRDRGYLCPNRFQPRPSTQFYYDPYSQRCRPFFFLGCGGNPNRFPDRRSCMNSCGCFSDVDSGNRCYFSSTRRYFFNKYTGTCDPFRFGGCGGGNDNNFQSRLECVNTCVVGTGPFFPGPFGRAPLGAFGGMMAATGAPSADASLAQSQIPVSRTQLGSFGQSQEPVSTSQSGFLRQSQEPIPRTQSGFLSHTPSGMSMDHQQPAIQSHMILPPTGKRYNLKSY